MEHPDVVAVFVGGPRHGESRVYTREQWARLCPCTVLPAAPGSPFEFEYYRTAMVYECLPRTEAAVLLFDAVQTAKAQEMFARFNTTQRH